MMMKKYIWKSLMKYIYRYISLDRMEDAKKTAAEYLGGGAVNKKILRKMLNCRQRYELSYSEFFLHDCYNRSYESIEGIISESALFKLVSNVNDEDYKYILQNKCETYKVFGEFYNRDLCQINDSADAEIFTAFFEKHKKAIIKPLDLSCGNGIKIVKAEGDILLLLSELLRDYAQGFVMEEVVEQNDQMKSFNDTSLNTVRIATFNTGNRVYIFPPYFRMGRKGKIVDNAHAGGISGIVDIDTGIISKVIDIKEGKTHLVHPDSHVQIIGFRIPYWKEAINLATTLSKVVPQLPYIGWDLALSNNGWVLIEGNYNSCVQSFQIAEKKGYKREFLELTEEYKNNKRERMFYEKSNNCWSI